MKIALICDSLLLQKTLQSYLKAFIVAKEDAQIVICDRLLRSDKPIFLVGHTERADLRVPFTQEGLLEAVQDFYAQNVDGNEIALTSKEQMQPFIEKLNKKHHNKIAKLARKIS